MEKELIRKFHVARALESVAACRDVVVELTEAEVMHCLQVETSTQRRMTVISTLIRRAAQINRRNYIRSLTEKFNVPTSGIQNFK